MVEVKGKSSFAFSILYNNKEDVPIEIQKFSKEEIAEILKIIEHPYEIVEKAITQCFELFEIPKKSIKKFMSDDGEVEFRNQSRIFNMSYKKVKENKDSKIIYQKLRNQDKIYAYEVEWIIFNVTWDKWSEKIRKIYAFIISQGTKQLIPGLGVMLGDFINKKIKETGDHWIIESINSEFNEIFYSILKTNPAIEYIKYQDKNLIKSKFLL